jgi:hypothetical protein
MPLPSAPFDPANSIYGGLAIIQLIITPNLTGIAAEADDDIFTLEAHGLTAGQALRFESGTGFTGLTAGTTYYVRDVLANTFKLSATYGGTAIDITLDGTAGVFAKLFIFESKMLEDSGSDEMKALEWPDAKGVVRPRRMIRSKSAESFKFESPEIKKLLPLFGGATKGRKNGLCTLWIPDPDDADSVCALKSETDFPCTIKRDGTLTHGNSDYSNATLIVDSLKNGEVLWDADAAV